MSTNIDISGRLKREKKTITLFGKTYRVNTSKNAVISAMNQLEKAKTTSETIKATDDILKILLGEKGFKDILSLNLDVADSQELLRCLISVATNTPIENGGSKKEN